MVHVNAAIVCSHVFSSPFNPPLVKTCWRGAAHSWQACFVSQDRDVSMFLSFWFKYGKEFATIVIIQRNHHSHYSKTHY